MLNDDHLVGDVRGSGYFPMEELMEGAPFCISLRGKVFDQSAIVLKDHLPFSWGIGAAHDCKPKGQQQRQYASNREQDKKYKRPYRHEHGGNPTPMAPLNNTSDRYSEDGVGDA